MRPAPGWPRTPTTRPAKSWRLLDRRGRGGRGQADLADRFAGTLQFGTAGLRGALGAGPNRMNRVVVTRAAAGLAAYLRDTGRDGRPRRDRLRRPPQLRRLRPRHRRVMTGAGFKALVLPRPLPTPLLAFAIRQLGCVGRRDGHRQPQPAAGQRLQGLPRRRQPDRPARRQRDRRRIAAVGPLAEVPRGDAGTLARRGDRRPLPRHGRRPGRGRPARPRIVYTPLHGVGGTTVAQVWRRAGFDAPHVVEQQAQPDPDFPTVAFPNPEEPGAMDLAMAPAARARRRPRGRQRPRRRPLRRRRARRARVADAARRRGRRPARHHLLARRPQGTYATSIVSSTPAGKMAAAAGQPTSRRSPASSGSAASTAWPSATRRRSATASTPSTSATRTASRRRCSSCELAARPRPRAAASSTCSTTSPREHGLHATDQLSVRFDDLAESQRPWSGCARPADALGGLAVQQVEDLSAGSRRCRRRTACATAWPTAPA